MVSLNVLQNHLQYFQMTNDACEHLPSYLIWHLPLHLLQ